MTLKSKTIKVGPLVGFQSHYMAPLDLGLCIGRWKYDARAVVVYRFEKSAFEIWEESSWACVVITEME